METYFLEDYRKVNSEANIIINPLANLDSKSNASENEKSIIHSSSVLDTISEKV